MNPLFQKITRTLAVLCMLSGLLGIGWPVSANLTTPGAQNLGPGGAIINSNETSPPPGLANAGDYPITSSSLSPEAQVFAFQANPAQPSAELPSDPNRVAVQPAPASPDSSTAAGIDDRENTDGTGWAVYEHQSIAQVVTTATNNNLRVVDLFPESTISPSEFTATYVSNSGSYARTWWILANVSTSDLLTFVLQNNARITVMKTLDNPAAPGDVRFYAVMISNTGADAKTWWFYKSQTTGQLTALWQANNARIVQVNSYMENGAKKYSAVMISNTGADQRGWFWWVDASPAAIAGHLSNPSSRLTDMDIDLMTGNYNVVITNCSSTCPMWWYYINVPTSNLLNLAFQDGARIIDANSVSGCGDRCWSFILINNSNAITSRVGQILRSSTDGTVGLLLKEVNGPVLANLMDGTVFEPASTLKAAVHLSVARRLQAGIFKTTDLIPKYNLPASGSCPSNTASGSETIAIADQEMMFHSDNTRTRELADYIGTSNLNLMLSSLGMSHTAINHVIGCGGPIENQTTLDDLAHLYEGVANASFVDIARRTYFFNHEAGKAQFQAEGYDWTGLWSTDIPKLINQEAPVGMSQAVKASFQKHMELAYKAGNYNICIDNACNALKYHISIFGYALIPSCHTAPKQFVFGVYIYNATNPVNSGNAFTATKAELLREQIHIGLSNWADCTYQTFLPTLIH